MSYIFGPLITLYLIGQTIIVVWFPGSLFMELCLFFINEPQDDKISLLC